MMAQLATDLVCRKLGVDKPCLTAVTPLPGSEKPVAAGHTSRRATEYSTRAQEGRHGTMTRSIDAGSVETRALVCECEDVTVGEVKFAVDKLHVRNLINLRRRTRMGMGTCQGELCACRGANVLCQVARTEPRAAEHDLAAFMAERWKGARPVAWGDTLGEAQLTATIYEGLCGLNRLCGDDKKIAL